jgi:hypothetical protein
MRLIMNTAAPAERSALLLNVDGPSNPILGTMAADPKEGDGTDGTDGDGTDGDGTDGTDGDSAEGDGADGDGTDGAAH